MLSADCWLLTVISLRHYFLVRSQRDQREILPVHVVHEVEHAREARTGEMRFVPGAFFFLRANKIGDASNHAITAGIFRGQQAQDGPRRLRRSAWTHALGIGIVVRAAGFSPPAIRVLHHAYPLGG